MVLLTPTTYPSSPSHAAALMLVIDSITAQYTPPWTIPYGWCRCGLSFELRLRAVNRELGESEPDDRIESEYC